MIDIKPIEDKSDEEIPFDIESDMGVETKKKLKKLIKSKEPKSELQKADEKEITEETTVIVTEEIIELPEDEKDEIQP
ncbi:hypothetical protein BLA29_014657, partial [Euroglyphus maynei]